MQNCYKICQNGLIIWKNVYNKIRETADTFASAFAGAGIAFTQGLSGNNFDELAGAVGAAIITRSTHSNNQNMASYNKAYSHIRDDVRTQHNKVSYT